MKLTVRPAASLAVATVQVLSCSHLGVPLRMVYAVEADVAGMVRSAEAAFWWGWESPYVNPDGTLAVGP